MNSLTKLRDAGFTVTLKAEGVLSVSPLSRLTDVQKQWLRDNKPTLVDGLKAEAANDSGEAEPMMQQCSECQHDKLSAVNPAGGLTWCAVRDDIPPKIRGTREMKCAQFEAVAND